MSKEILLPGECDFNTEDFELISLLLERHFDKVSRTLYKVNHLLRSDESSSKYEEEK